MKNKNLLVLLGVIAIIAVVIFAQKTNKRQEMASGPQPTPTPQATKSPVPVRTGTAKPVAEQAELYTDLVKEYEGRRIQFDAACQAIPSSSTYKIGTKVMFDNRSGDARWISVGGMGYQFSGYGYRIITLTSKTLPANLLISCGAAVNVGQILLQN